MNVLTEAYWPWWFGAPAFALLVVGIWVLERRLLGVSGSLRRAVSPETASERALFTADQSSIEDAMLKATLEEFGPEAVEAFMKEMAETEQPAAEPASKQLPNRTPLPRSTHLVFLAMILVGGLLGGLLTGRFEIRGTLGVVHTTVMHGELGSFIALVVGGVLVGLGARMSGGCTSGHGLSGCSRLEPASLVATSLFFGIASGTAFLLRYLV